MIVPLPRPRPEKGPHLRLVPPTAGERRRLWPTVVLLTIIGMLLSGAGVYAWQHGQVVEAQRALRRTEAAREAQVSALQAQSADLRTELASAGARVTVLRGRVERLRERLETAAATREQLSARLQEARHELWAARQRLHELVGPVLRDGRHFGRIMLVGAVQTPPMLVIDRRQWLTGDAADEAALEDGVIEPGEHVEYYIRNKSWEWRVVEVSPTVVVRILDREGPGLRTISLDRFGDLFTQPVNRSLGQHRFGLYWVTVTDGRIIRMVEQYLP